MKIFVFTLFVLLSFLFNSQSVFSQSPVREAQCDVCGYCKGKTVPSNWSDCAKCVYSDIDAIKTVIEDGNLNNSVAQQNHTLKIETDTAKSNYNKPPEPRKGRSYTQLGCLGASDGLSSFTNFQAPGALANIILNNLIFPTVGILAFFTIIYGAFVLVTAQGDIYKIQQGKRLVGSSLVGLIFTLTSVLIINTIGSQILRLPNVSGVDGKITLANGLIVADFSGSSGPKYRIGVAKCSSSDCRSLTASHWGTDKNSNCGNGYLSDTGTVSGDNSTLYWCMLEVNPDPATKKVTWNSPNISNGDKYVFVVNNEIDADRRCSGNPICSFNGGNQSCSGYISCSDNDFLIFP